MTTCASKNEETANGYVEMTISSTSVFWTTVPLFKLPMKSSLTCLFRLQLFVCKNALTSNIDSLGI